MDHSRYGILSGGQYRTRSNAAAAMVAMDVVAMVSNDKETHPTYGVLDPTDPKQREGKRADEVGTLVEISDVKQTPLASIIIGKKVRKDPKKCFVRQVGQDRVFVVKLDRTTYSTDIADWFERKILKLEGDLAGMTIVHKGKRDDVGNSVPVSTSELKFEQNKWSLVKATELVKGKLIEQKLTDNEELRTEKIDSLKSALERMEIVKVAARSEETEIPELGQFALTQNDGVQLRIRFGIEHSVSSTEKTRMVVVDAAVSEAQLPKPKMEEVPEVTESDAGDKDGKKSDGKKSDGKKSDDKKSDDKKSGDKKSDDKKSDDKKDKKKVVTKEQRDEVVRRNQVMMDDWKDKMKKAQAKVDELNFRYRDWVFLMKSDDFLPMQTTRYQIVKEKKSVDGVDVFRELKKKGLSAKPKADPAK